MFIFWIIDYPFFGDLLRDTASAPEMASKEELSVSMGVFLVSLVQEWYMGQFIVRSPKLRDTSKPITGLNLELTMKNSQVNVLPP